MEDATWWASHLISIRETRGIWTSGNGAWEANKIVPGRQSRSHSCVCTMLRNSDAAIGLKAKRKSRNFVHGGSVRERYIDFQHVCLPCDVNFHLGKEIRCLFLISLLFREPNLVNAACSHLISPNQENLNCGNSQRCVEVCFHGDAKPIKLTALTITLYKGL